MRLGTWTLTTVWVALLCITFTTSQGTNGCTGAYTAYFVVDGSESINNSSFEEVRIALMTFVNESIRSNSNTRVGVVVYSDDVFAVINASSDINFLTNQIRVVGHPSSETFTHLGIRRAKLLLDVDTSGNPHIMIVMTDGLSNYPDDTKAAALETKNSGIRVFAVGVNPLLNFPSSPYKRRYEQELVDIASDNSTAIQIEDFDNLLNAVQGIVQNLCRDIVSVVSRPVSITRLVNSPASFTVGFNRQPTGGSWIKLTPSRIDLTTDNRFQKTANGLDRSLALGSVVLSDGGTYTYSFGSLSPQAMLTVFTPLSNITSSTGQNAIFETQVTPTEAADGFWLKDGVRVDTFNSKYTITKTATGRRLVVNNVQSSDQGEYTFNLNGVTTRGFLSVLAVITSNMRDVTFLSGTSPQLATAVNPPGVTNGVWRREGVDLTGDNRYTKNTIGALQSLTIPNVQTSQAGQYSYSVDGSTTQATLTVLGRMENFTRSVGESQSFLVNVSPGATAGAWFRNGVPLTSGAKYSITQNTGTLRRMTVQNIQTSDSGEYVYVVNGVESKGYLTVIGDDDVGEWSQWSPAACTATCGPGEEGSVERSRSCITPANNISCTAALTETRMENCALPICPATTTPTPSTCGPMTDASLDEDCSNARCVAVNSSCVTTSAGSRRCACVSKNVQISATECSLGPSVLSSTTNYVFSTDLSRTSETVGSIMFDGLSTFPTNTFSIEGEVYPDEGILDLRRNSSNIDVALAKEISNAKTFVVALHATSGEFTVQQVVTVRITSSSFTPEDVTVMLVEGTRKGTLIADVRTIGSLGGYSNFEMETTDQTARALFNVTTSGQVLCGQDMFLSDFTNNDTVAKEYNFSVKATKGGQRETIAPFYILLFKSTFTTTLRENWKGNILSYTITSSKFQVAINDTLPDRLKLSEDLMTISLVEEIDYDAGITSIHFKLDLVTTNSTKSTTVDVHINIEDQNDERPKFKKTVYEFSLLAGSKGNSVVGVVDVTDGDTVGQTTFSLEGRNKNDFSINEDGVLTSKVDLTRGRFPSAISLRVKAYDGVSYSDEVNITVYLISYTINAVNLNKTFLGRVSENSPGAFVANVAVSNHTSYKFANPQADRFFNLNSTSGLVTTTTGLDRENDDQAYTAFTIQAYMDSGDQCSPVTIGQLITNITDVNDNAPEFSSPSYTGRVKENSIPGTLVVGMVDIAVTDEDTGVNGSVNFALTGPGKTYFAVQKLNHNQFTIKTSGTQIDRELTPYVVLTLTGTDNPSNPNTGTTALNITIMDVNDNAPQFNGGSTVFWVEENVGPKTITTLTATDRDEGLNAKVSYSLKDGGFGFFQVDESTGEVSTIKAIDRENRKVFNLSIEAKDQGSPSQESVLTIRVNIRDVNDEKPAFTEKYYKGAYTENSSCDRNILTVTATDQDEGSNAHITFSTTSSNFTVNNTTGAIRCMIPLDYEEMQQHLIEIKAENPGFPKMSDTVTVEINVEDENDNSPRFDKPNYQSEITTWEWATDNPVDVFEVTDEDSGTNGQFILSMSGETDKFYIDGDTIGVLRIKEGASQPVASTTYNFDITATDKGSPSQSDTVTVSVDVKKIQGNSTVRFSSKDFRFSIEENRLNTTSFGRANAAHDASVSVRYTLIHGGDFRIDPSSGALTCSKPQDRETAANHTMVVRARDPTTNASDVAVITVQILDVNDNGPIFLASSGQLVFQVEENSPGKEIGRIIAKDGDADENGRITYSIESQTPQTHFSINPESGTVTVSGGLNREAHDTYNLIIKATDNGAGPKTATTSATILVLDVNDNPPTFQTTYAVTVKENSPISASVEIVSATDGDLAQHGAIVYASNTVMVNGTVCPFKVSVDTGVVKVSADLDYETTSTYECIVTAVDMKGCSNCTGRLNGSTTMSVTILDFNDNPPVFQGAPYRANISRDSNINTLVTDVITATDRDSVIDGNGVVTYHILSNISYFRIDRNSGRIFVATTLDKVNDDEVTLRIKATDLPQDDPAMEAITSITISILTDQPRPFFNKTYTFLLTENEKPDEDKLVSIRAYVRRSSAEECNCTYDIIGSDNSSFYIDSMTGDLRQKDPIDREKTGSRFYVKVKATDRRSLLYRTTDVAVNVTDVNDNLPFFKNNQQNFIVNQSAPAGHVIGRVMSVDADELSHPIYTAFTDVEGIKLLGNGTLVVRASLSNYTRVDMIVSVTEGNFTGPINISAVTTTKAFIEVRPDDFNERAPKFEQVAYEASLEFSSETDTEVKITNFQATDPDGHNVTYAIQTRNDRENLKIDGQTGKISVHIKFDDTVPEVIKLVIIATDESPYPKTGSCTVTITLQGYTQTKCVAENAYSQLQQQRELFLGLFIAMAALLAVISIAAVFAIYKWRTVRRRTQYQENINTAHGKTTKSSEQAGYDSLAAGSKDEETAYNNLKDRDFSSGVPNPAYVSTGPRPTCTPPTDPLPDYVDEDANRM